MPARSRWRSPPRDSVSASRGRTRAITRARSCCGTALVTRDPQLAPPWHVDGFAACRRAVGSSVRPIPRIPTRALAGADERPRFAAAALPAWRATRVDPATALRRETDHADCLVHSNRPSPLDQQAAWTSAEDLGSTLPVENARARPIRPHHTQPTRPQSRWRRRTREERERGAPRSICSAPKARVHC